MNFVALLIPLIALLQPTGPKFSAKLHAADESVQPGAKTELAVELNVEKGWHIYHPVILDTGAPTKIDFEAPGGITIGALRFPTPQLGEEAGLEYLALSGRVVVLAPVQVAADATPGPITIRATVFALACKELCLPVQADVELKLNVSTEPPKPANAKLFKEGRDELPPALERAKYIEGSRLLVTRTKVPVGGSAELVAAIKVKAKHHIQDRDPGVEGNIPSRLFIEARDGIKFDKERETWPKPRIEKVPDVGNVREQAGEVVVRVPFVIDDEKFEPGPIRLGVLFQYQACKDGGECFLPTVAESAVEFEVVAASEPAVANTDPLVEKLPPLPAAAAKAAAGAGGTSSQTPLSMPLVFLFAFLGGVILNIMPCVLPVISLKIFGFVQQAGDDPRRIFRMGLVYGVGILASFAVIAVLMITAGIAWGGLMQRPAFLIGLSAVVFAFALSLLGVFEIQLPGKATDVASAAASKEGYAGAFLNGVMTTLLATPCVGPFLGTAIGVLAQLPPAVAGSGIMVVGVGLATPYVLLTAFPGWLRFLPKPGAWMITFKQIVGFILVLVVLWLLSILVKAVDSAQFLGTLGLLCAVGIACWLVGKITLSDSVARALTLWILALVVAIGGGLGSFALFNERESRIPWQEWQPGLAEKLTAEGYAVYVDYTASWCLTCQANKKLVLETDRIAREFKKLGIYPIKADFTKLNPEMHEEIRKHGRDGVPLNLIFPPGEPDQPLVLPEVLTPQVVLDALAKTPPSRTTPEFWSRQP